MNYPVQAVIANAIGIMLLCSLLMNFFRKYKHREKEIKVFAGMIFVNILQCLVEPATIILDGKQFPGAVPLLTALNAILYMGNITFAYLWATYADMHVKSRLRPAWKAVKAIPAVLIMIGAVVNLFTPVFFYVTPENVYGRTGGFAVAYVVTYFYLMWGTLVAYRRKYKWERYVLLPAVTFLLPVILASVFQVIFAGISLLWVGAAIGLTSAYISLLDEGAAVEPLSGVFSRHHMNQYLHALPKHAKDTRYGGLMLDVDDFKQINDRYGHLVGDDVIRNVGKLLRRAVRSEGMVFRYAGDEFTVILPVTGEEGLRNMIRKINVEVERFNASGHEPYKLHFSVGYAIFEQGENIKTFVKRMDDAMYANKKHAHAVNE